MPLRKSCIYARYLNLFSLDGPSLSSILANEANPQKAAPHTDFNPKSTPMFGLF
ncbi:hypothetical protein QJS04_geneDACA021465 [Acorus gramineus]|uniref:Uncharacterized protein n=1 Tax=Acorus gramineus TaxID=55184 RepID=A0AAV9B944_ACOGR|nr:hypothetical protein QJS04_geneDACA021465 [Acorus gramineus]